MSSLQPTWLTFPPGANLFICVCRLARGRFLCASLTRVPGAGRSGSFSACRPRTEPPCAALACCGSARVCPAICVLSGPRAVTRQGTAKCDETLASLRVAAFPPPIPLFDLPGVVTLLCTLWRATHAASNGSYRLGYRTQLRRVIVIIDILLALGGGHEGRRKNDTLASP